MIRPLIASVLALAVSTPLAFAATAPSLDQQFATVINRLAFSTIVQGLDGAGQAERELFARCLAQVLTPVIPDTAKRAIVEAATDQAAADIVDNYYSPELDAAVTSCIDNDGRPDRATRAR